MWVPPRYFSATGTNFPVVLVVLPAAGGPGSPVLDGAGPAVLVFVRTDEPDAKVLTRTLPERLDTELRTVPRGWGIIGAGGLAATVARAAAHQPGPLPVRPATGSKAVGGRR